MKSKSKFALILAGSLLLPLGMAYADDDASNGHPLNYLKDSAITTAVKSKLAAEHLKSVKNIKVDTDDKGIVWLSGSASSESQVHRAESLARETDGVREVKNHIVIRPDD